MFYFLSPLIKVNSFSKKQCENIREKNAREPKGAKYQKQVLKSVAYQWLGSCVRRRLKSTWVRHLYSGQTTHTTSTPIVQPPTCPLKFFSNDIFDTCRLTGAAVEYAQEAGECSWSKKGLLFCLCSSIALLAPMRGNWTGQIIWFAWDNVHFSFCSVKMLLFSVFVHHKMFMK